MDSNEYYTQEEISGFLENISDEDSAHLMKMAKRRWKVANLRESRDGSANDILHEAVMLTLNCDHKWKRGIELRLHFWWVIRNIGGRWAGKGLKSTQGATVLEEKEASEERIATYTSPVFECAREQDAFDHAHKLFFSDDELAWNVFESMIRGKGKKAIMNSFSLDDRNYNRILKRIRRKLDNNENGENHEFR
ncbi:hypothetical protein PDESU_02237 [Pontiella desulfatans]|uniref:Uncharacterized protein n=1 Tax=Pontiella desulfatans TaxID=2750659 RepID=A0A6C2U130_PONDE|nr:hypothetical protein [Pontiella desulfatans]VGO13680.1 hypothetical protein PDESU_02237 [Pontiella desulfatans]